MAADTDWIRPSTVLFHSRICAARGSLISRARNTFSMGFSARLVPTAITAGALAKGDRGAGAGAPWGGLGGAGNAPNCDVSGQEAIRFLPACAASPIALIVSLFTMT